MDLPPSTVIEFIFFEKIHDSRFETVSVTDERYADVLQNFIIPSLAHKHLLVSMTFIQDGAPPRIGWQVKELLCRSIGDDRVQSHHFRFAWRHRSPDLNSCDYGLWGYLKLQVATDINRDAKTEHPTPISHHTYRYAVQF